MKRTEVDERVSDGSSRRKVESYTLYFKRQRSWRVLQDAPHSLQIWISWHTSIDPVELCLDFQNCELINRVVLIHQLCSILLELDTSTGGVMMLLVFWLVEIQDYLWGVWPGLKSRFLEFGNADFYKLILNCFPEQLNHFASSPATQKSCDRFLSSPIFCNI